jgi:hypothetical protein
MPSSSSRTLRASGSASSMALDSSERATVPGWTWSRSARRAAPGAPGGDGDGDEAEAEEGEDADG